MYCVYILYSKIGGKYYVGQTGNIANRLQSHNELSEDSYTSKFRPWELKRIIEVESRNCAMKMEKYIKGRKSRKYIEELIEDSEKVKKLKKRLFPSSVD